ncbi:family 16 glycoside hydrolase [Prosthecobacter sp. SYSU 5D2]|uniref:family 16 glycoside hydrolase n=1 Tax=Prosthecobacter sp. SYSU 5D2 TaxID=3134134 RepID=UPI0031FEF913
MLRSVLLVSFLHVATVCVSAQDDNSLVEKQGRLLFSDDFNRDETTPDKEEIGNGWTTNSAWRAKGKKQVDLKDGAMAITRVPEADHGVAIFHDVAFQDGAVKLKFKLGENGDLGVDFVDRGDKTVHAGHLCVAQVTPKNVTLKDSKTGMMNLEIRERRLKEGNNPELAKLLKGKSAGFPLSLDAEAWHEMLIVVQGDVMRFTLNGTFIGQLQSEGIAHPTKRMITLAVNKTAMVDDVQVWSLKD